MRSKLIEGLDIMKKTKLISDKHSKFFGNFKFVFLIAVIAVLALLLPGAIPEAAPVAGENATVTVTGTVKDASGNPIAADKKPYVQIALLVGLGEEFEQEVEVVNGNFSIPNVPDSVFSNYGVITAGAIGYANEILAYPGSTPSTKFDFKLNTGINCTFVNESTKLKDYYLCTGSYMVPSNGSKIAIPLDIGLGAGLPSFGLPAGGIFTENIDTGALIYQYKGSGEVKEEFKFIFTAHPESGYQFNY